MPEFDPYYKWLGIPPKDQPPHHYRLLGIELFEPDPDVIDSAANKQMAFLKTCAMGPHVALSQRLLNEMAAARLCLLDPNRKSTYDADLKNKLATDKEIRLSAAREIARDADEEFDPYHKWLCIPKDMRPPTLYQLLGISPSEEDRETIAAAAERQQAFLKQFLGGPHDAQAVSLLYEIEDAAFRLLSPESRRKYDVTLHLAHQRQGRTTRGTAARPNSARAKNVGEEKDLARQYFKFVGILVASFAVMAVLAFNLLWKKLTARSVEHPAAAPIANAMEDSQQSKESIVSPPRLVPPTPGPPTPLPPPAQPPQKPVADYAESRAGEERSDNAVQLNTVKDENEPQKVPTLSSPTPRSSSPENLSVGSNIENGPFEGTIRFEQVPTTLSLKAGGSAELDLTIVRTGQRAPATVQIQQMPPGLSCRSLTLAADAWTGKLVISAKPSCEKGTYDVQLVAESRGKKAQRMFTINVAQRVNSESLSISMGDITPSRLKLSQRLKPWVFAGVFAKIRGEGKVRFPEVREATYVFELDLQVTGSDVILFRLDQNGKAAELSVRYDDVLKRTVCQLYRCDGGNYWPGANVPLPPTKRHYLKVLVVENRQWLFSDDEQIDTCDAPRLQPSLEIRCGSKGAATVYRCAFRRPTDEELRSVGLRQ